MCSAVSECIYWFIFTKINKSIHLDIKSCGWYIGPRDSKGLVEVCPELFFRIIFLYQKINRKNKEKFGKQSLEDMYNNR